MQERTNNEVFEMIVGHFTSDIMPDDWQKWRTECIEEWIDQTRWEHVEHWELDFLVRHINQLTRNVCAFFDIPITRSP